MALNNRSKSEGVALLMTLVFTFVLSLLVLSGLGHKHLHSKLFTQMKDRQDLFYHAESTLIEIQQSLRGERRLACIRETMAVNDFFSGKFLNNTCERRESSYHDRYLIENRGVLACLDGSGGTERQLLQHYRINLISRADSMRVALQANLIVARKHQQVACLRGETRDITEGFKSWREIQ